MNLEKKIRISSLTSLAANVRALGFPNERGHAGGRWTVGRLEKWRVEASGRRTAPRAAEKHPRTYVIRQFWMKKKAE